MNVDIFTLLFILGFIVTIISTTDFIYKKQIAKVAMYSFAFILFFLSALRSLDIGYDYVLHKQYFENIRLGVTRIRDFQEPGYAMLSYIVSFVGGDYVLFLFVYSLISIVILLKVVNHYSLYPFLSVYIYYSLYFFNQNMSRLRLSLSVLILLIAIEYLYKKNTKYFILTVILAASFHTSSLVFLVLYPLMGIKFTKKKMILFTVFSIILGLVFIGNFYRLIIGGMKISIIPDLFGFDRIITEATRKNAVRDGGLYGFLYHILQVVILIYFYEPIKKLGEKEYMIYLIYFIGLLIYFLFFDVPILGRLSIGFTLTEIIVASYYLQCIQNKYHRFLFIVLYLIMILLFGYKGFFNYYDNFVPYRFFWQ